MEAALKERSSRRRSTAVPGRRRTSTSSDQPPSGNPGPASDSPSGNTVTHPDMAVDRSDRTTGAATGSHAGGRRASSGSSRHLLQRRPSLAMRFPGYPGPQLEAELAVTLPLPVALSSLAGSGSVHEPQAGGGHGDGDLRLQVDDTPQAGPQVHANPGVLPVVPPMRSQAPRVSDAALPLVTRHMDSTTAGPEQAAQPEPLELAHRAQATTTSPASRRDTGGLLWQRGGPGGASASGAASAVSSRGLVSSPQQPPPPKGGSSWQHQVPVGTASPSLRLRGHAAGASASGPTTARSARVLSMARK